MSSLQDQEARPRERRGEEPPRAEPFTLQEYYTPTERRSLGRFPRLVGMSFTIVWQAARRELIEIIVLQTLIGAAGASLSIGAIAIALLLLQPLFCLLILLAYVPAWVATNRAGELGYRHSLEQTERERRRQYLFEVLTTKQPAQEVRAFG